MLEFTEWHFALMGGNLLAGTVIGWFARTLTTTKSEPAPAVVSPKRTVEVQAVDVIADLTQSTVASSNALQSFERKLDEAGQGLSEEIVTEVRAFGQCYSVELKTDVSHLAEAALRQDLVLRHVIAKMTSHSENVDRFNRSVGKDIDRALPEEIKGILSVAIAELLQCNRNLENELNSARQELEKQADELANARRDARIDPLTKIANRRSFEESFEAAHAKFLRSGESYTLAMFDLDHFKNINDTYGHATGDVVLQVFAKVLQDVIRKYDVAARFGGEEFVLLLPKTNQKDGTVIAERIRRQTATKTVRQGETSIGFTVSAGVALSAPEDTTDSLLMRADAALYNAKCNGRNRVQFGFTETKVETTDPQPAESHV